MASNYEAQNFLGYAHILDQTIVGEITWDEVVGMPDDPKEAFEVTANYVEYFADAHSPTGAREVRSPYWPVWWSVQGQRAVHLFIPNVRDNANISGVPGAQHEQQPYTEIIVTLKEGVAWEHGGRFAPHVVSQRVVNPPVRKYLKPHGIGHIAFVVELSH